MLIVQFPFSNAVKDLNRNSGFGSGKTWVFGFGQNFGSKVKQILIKSEQNYEILSHKVVNFSFFQIFEMDF